VENDMRSKITKKILEATPQEVKNKVKAYVDALIKYNKKQTDR
jgi:hypothetical protein